MRPAEQPRVNDVALSLVGSALAVKLHAELGRPGHARAELHRALDLLADLDDRLPPELPDPLPAPAVCGPRQIGAPTP